MPYVERKARGLLRVRKQQGLLKYLFGHLKLLYYRFLQRKYGFDKWHITPYELRPYAVEIVRYVNTQGNPGGMTLFVKLDAELGIYLEISGQKRK